MLLVDHTFIYTGAVRKMKELLDTGELGHLYYFDSVRVNLGVFAHDSDVLWDLAPHDLSILTHLIPRTPTYVSAVGVDHVGTGFADMVYLTIHFEDSFLAHAHVNWLSPVKVRQILIGGDRRMLSTTTRSRARRCVLRQREPSHDARGFTQRSSITAPRHVGSQDRIARGLSAECEHLVDCDTPEEDADHGWCRRVNGGGIARGRQ